MLLKIEEDKKSQMLDIVDENIDKEEFICEISEHILERVKNESILVKEKVKEI
jgi:hypothetical protein